MALPPTVPSSFVPYSGSSARKYRRADFGGAFGFLSYGIFFLMVAAAIGVFIYGRLLVGQRNAADASLAKAEAQLDSHTVSDFLRLENRLKLGAQLLDQHVALSNFFTQLDTTIPATVRLSSLTLAADSSGDGAFTLESEGSAASLNALAQFSSALGANGKIKNVIISNIKVSQKDNSVAFSLNALVDKSLVAFSAASARPMSGAGAQQATSTSTATAATSTP